MPQSSAPEKTTIKLARPFIKWAGGKRQLLAQFARYYPAGLQQGTIRRVIEPFVGSGAVFLELAQHYPVAEFILNDANPEIIRVYQAIQHAPETLIAQLGALQTRYLALDENARETFYYQIRRAYNEQRHASEPPPEANKNLTDYALQRAAWTIFLNKTCFNGLFRVNAKGEFNVPFGRYRRPTICAPDNLYAVSEILQRATLMSGDYTQVEPHVDGATFVYFDPPYRPLTRTASFTSYAAGGFDDQAQVRLARFYARLHDQTGARLMLSNADPANIDPDDDFFQRLYAGFHIHRVHAGRAINSNGRRRGKITELLITNYPITSTNSPRFSSSKSGPGDA